MSDLKNKFAAKVIAVVLFVIFLTATVLSTVCIIFGFSVGTFVPKDERYVYKNDLSSSMLHRYYGPISSVLSIYTFSTNKNGYRLEDELSNAVSENVVCEIKDSNGKLIFSNVSVPISDVHLHLLCEVKNDAHKDYETEYDDNTSSVDSTVETITFYITVEAETVETYDVNLYVVKDLSVNDEFYYVPKLFDFVSNNDILLFVIDFISIIASVGLCIFILCASGHKEDEDGIYISRFDKFPIDILAAAYVGLTSLLLFGISIFIGYIDLIGESLYTGITVLLIIGIIIGIIFNFVLLTILLMTIAVRLKTKTFIKSTFTYKLIVIAWKTVKYICKIVFKVIKGIFKFIFKGTKKAFGFVKKVPFVWKTVLAIIVIAGYELILVCLTLFDGVYSILFVFGNVLLAIGILLLAMQLKRIKDTTKDIANGNVYRKIDTKHMFLDVKEHAENINHINDGIANAVQERMKSERFKTELITNVSHDIKTPLTSIINYVDLLGKEEIENETAKEYINVLSRQSTRLKKLIEDLLEASKASTGNINLNLVECELGILLAQVLGEYDERFKKNDLQVVLNKTDNLLYIMADNCHMWRIFDNILNNIAKYAQPNTRVYVDAVRKNKTAEISFRNISKDELNISGEELMERFVRGDSSRNTEGSGLGLSIAKSLAELQKGSLDIQIDGDLFKAKLTFPINN